MCVKMVKEFSHCALYDVPYNGSNIIIKDEPTKADNNINNTLSSSKDNLDTDITSIVNEYRKNINVRKNQEPGTDV